MEYRFFDLHRDLDDRSVHYAGAVAVQGYSWPE
jgi:hypothetical protein